MRKKIINKALAYGSYSLGQEVSLAKPIIYQIEPTNACMMDCIMCPRKNMTRKIGFMDFDLFKDIINQAKWTDHLWLHHFGDPLLHPKIVEMVDYVSRKKISVGISVNPKLLTEEMSYGLINAGLNTIIISLDATNDEEYKKIRGKNANYNEAIENIETFLKIKRILNSQVFVEIQMVKMKTNKEHISFFKNKWKKKGVNKVAIKQFITFDGSSKEVIAQGDNETMSERFKNKERKERCSWSWVGLVVLWDGRVVPCCYDYDGKYIVGDLNIESLVEIWNNNQMRLIRKQTNEGKLSNNPLCKFCYDIRTESIKERLK